MSPQRRRFKATPQTFAEHLAEEAASFRKAAEEAPPGLARELLLRRARQAELASHINGWVPSPELQPSK